jgi:hypothetical protein
MCCDCCDDVSWDDYFNAVAAIIEGGGPLAEIVKSRIEEDFKRDIQWLGAMSRWAYDKDKGKGKTVRFMKYFSLPLDDDALPKS